MITAYLEKLIHEGKASYKTAVLGGAGAHAISVPDQSYVVITDFVTFHFIDVADNEDFDEVFKRSVYQIIYKSDRSENHFIARSSLRFDKVQDAPPVFRGYAYGHAKFDTYLVHVSDISISVSMASEFPIVVTTAELSQTLKAQQPPLGYGSGDKGSFNTITTGTFANGDTYMPQLPKNTPVLPATSPQFGGLQFGIDNTSKFLGNAFASAAGIGQTSYPIINVGYVQINQQINEYIQSSS